MTIRPGAGFHPQIVFRPEISAPAEQRQMIRLAGGSTSRVTVQGVQFRLELPTEPSFGWSLFSLGHVQSVDLADSVITVRDHGTLGGPVHDQVAVFAIAPRRAAETGKIDDESAMTPPMALALTRCIVRGEATLVSMPEETPFNLIWNQGLLVTPRRLIETGGTPYKPTLFGRIEIDLDQVTAIMRQGLYQIKRRGGALHQLDLDVMSKRSILYTFEDTALFEFNDVPSIDEIKLAFDGLDNCYPRPDVTFLRLKPSASEAAVEFDLENRSRWSIERRPDVGIVWKSPPPDDLPLHKHEKQHYLQAEGATNEAGFDAGQLPEVLGVPQPPESVLPMDDPAPKPPMLPVEEPEEELMPSAPPDGATMPTKDREALTPSNAQPAKSTDAAMPSRSAMPVPGP